VEAAASTPITVLAAADAANEASDSTTPMPRCSGWHPTGGCSCHSNSCPCCIPATAAGAAAAVIVLQQLQLQPNLAQPLLPNMWKQQLTPALFQLHPLHNSPQPPKALQPLTSRGSRSFSSPAPATASAAAAAAAAADALLLTQPTRSPLLGRVRSELRRIVEQRLATRRLS
jgi:hypothetical protein